MIKSMINVWPSLQGLTMSAVNLNHLYSKLKWICMVPAMARVHGPQNTLQGGRMREGKSIV